MNRLSNAFYLEEEAFDNIFTSLWNRGEQTVRARRRSSDCHVTPPFRDSGHAHDGVKGIAVRLKRVMEWNEGRWRKESCSNRVRIAVLACGEGVMRRSNVGRKA